MKELIIRVDSHGCAVSDGYAGVSGDHLAGCITVEFEKMPQAEYFRMFFKSGSSQIYTEKLYPQGNRVKYTVPNSISVMSSDLIWQIYGYKMDGENYELLYVTDAMPIYFGNSISPGGIQADGDFQSSLEEKLSEVENFVDGFDIDVEDVQTVESHQDAQVEITKNGYQFGLNFSVPKGEKGDDGINGTNGVTPILLENVPDYICVPINAENHVKSVGSTHFNVDIYPDVMEGNTKKTTANITASITNPPGVENTDYGFVVGSISTGKYVRFWISQNYTFDRPYASNCYITVNASYAGVLLSKKVNIYFVYDGLKGDTGEQGEQGEQGIQGIQGIQGEKGEKGDTGEQGEAGQDGTDGADGIDGTSPYILTKLPDTVTAPIGKDGKVICNAKSNPALPENDVFDLNLPYAFMHGEEEITYYDLDDTTVTKSDLSDPYSVSMNGNTIIFRVFGSTTFSTHDSGQYFTFTAEYGDITLTKKIYVQYVFDGKDGEDGSGGAVDDVRVDGTTILEDGIANLHTLDTSASMGHDPVPYSEDNPIVVKQSLNDTMNMHRADLSAHPWKEDISHKVTSISSASTDTQYPSAKAVYDYIQSLDGSEVEY